MYTVLSRKCVKLVYGFLVLYFVTKSVESAKISKYQPSNPYHHTTTTQSKRFTLPSPPTTTKKPKNGSTGSEELLTNIEDQSKQAPTEVHPWQHDPCVLGAADLYISWWINENGSLSLPDDIAEMTLDFSGFVELNSTVADEIRIVQENHLLGEPDIVLMSIAYSNLTRIPKEALQLVDDTLQYLSLTGNYFSDDEPETNHNHVSSQEPTLDMNLELELELDMRKCQIHYLRDGAFENLINLQKLFLSHNYIDEIGTTVFQRVPNLIHLDLSHNIVDDSTLTRGALTKTFEGIKFDNDFQFSHLGNLLFLDLSHSKVSILSTPSFTAMPSSLRMLSLCYTAISHIPDGMFANSNKLQVLDLSGNPSLAYYSQGGSLSNLSNSMIKSLGLICRLENLKILQLEGNNINQINNNTFYGLEQLEMLDLSSNHLSNWYSRVFEKNPNLRLLQLRNNNINLITSAMYEDFSSLKYLALGNNDFICHCQMREFMDRAISNSHPVNSTTIENEMPTVTDTLNDLVATGYEAMLNQNQTFSYNIRQRMLYKYLELIGSSYENILKTKKKNVKYNLQIYKPKPTPNRRIVKRSSEIDEDGFDFTFQLLDFRETNYKCVNSSSNYYYNLSDINTCFGNRSLDIGGIQNISNKLIIIISVFVFILISFLVVYYKWWYVRYFFVIIKNAAILSYLGKEKIVQPTEREEEDEEAFTYDVFVSYCDQNRDWIIDEFLPNDEHHRDIKVCLHERDFQVGLSILENIISCMDRSRCLLLVVSQNFLLSQFHLFI